MGLEHHTSINRAVSSVDQSLTYRTPFLPLCTAFCVAAFSVDEEERTGGDDSPASSSLLAKIYVEHCEDGRELESLYW